ncbi:MAG: radical SAM protein [Lachnospiraceae bacterium]|nr:radical SAM protein [Lachnospiraceae bacterium]
MNYILEDNIRLRKWKDSSFCYISGERDRKVPLTEAEYALLRQCDGKTDLNPCDLLYSFEAMRVISRCGKDEAVPAADAFVEYPNYYFKYIDWTITERCNYNCLHCFHAADNDRHTDEFSREEALSLIKEAAECGIEGIRLTGGEPLLYPHFREILLEIKKSGLRLATLITNGSLLDGGLLDHIRKVHPDTTVMISFDGIGTHDWLRQHSGSEDQVKKAIRLSKEYGFSVKINMNVNRRNRARIFESVQMLVGLGVDKIRIIKTTEAPRWQLNAAEDSLTIREYYDFSSEFASQYKNCGLLLPVTIWQSLYLNGKKKEYGILPVKTSKSAYRDDLLICNAMKRKVSVQANGDIIPCAPLAGLYTSLGVKTGNVKRDGLKAVLSKGQLTMDVTKTVGEKRSFPGKCGACPYFENCQGGCPALSMLFGGSFLSADDYKCAFFDGGYYEKYQQALSGWRERNPLDD